jgi:hypothetical protein
MLNPMAKIPQIMISVPTGIELPIFGGTLG